MHLEYYREVPNFGDALNPILGKHVFGDIFNEDRATKVLFIGTIIGCSVEHGTHEVIIGAGAGYQRGRYSTENRTILCVRGPLTCDLLGIDKSHAAIDPAILTSRFFAPSAGTGPAFMPHHRTHSVAGTALKAICEDSGIEYISPLADTETVISRVAAASHVITEALHGAIVAESFNIPWVPVIFGTTVLELKWHGFVATIGGAYRPIDISPNVAFDGVIQPMNIMKFAASKFGIGKPKYKYLPVRRATPTAMRKLQADLVKLKQGPFVKSDSAVKAKSIQKLDDAIGRFHDMRGRFAAA